MIRFVISPLLTSGLLLAGPLAAEVGVGLRGSPGSMERQHQVAEESDYTFLATASQVEDFVEKGRLVRLDGNSDYRTHQVSFPYGRPELKTFVERLASQYRDGCGEQMVVTSLTRPRSAQPGNSHRLSVHPTGMAVDLRISNSAACRAWLESVLLSLESKGLLDVTREQRPPHYHIAVFPEPYRAHIARLEADSLGAALATGDVRKPETAGAASLAALPRVSGFTAGGAGAEGTGSRLGALLVVGMLYGGLGWGLIRRRRRS